MVPPFVALLPTQAQSRTPQRAPVNAFFQLIRQPDLSCRDSSSSSSSFSPSSSPSLPREQTKSLPLPFNCSRTPQHAPVNAIPTPLWSGLVWSGFQVRSFGNAHIVWSRLSLGLGYMVNGLPVLYRSRSRFRPSLPPSLGSGPGHGYGHRHGHRTLALNFDMEFCLHFPGESPLCSGHISNLLFLFH